MNEQGPINYTVIGDHGEVLHGGTADQLPNVAGVIPHAQPSTPSWWDGERFVAIAPQPTPFHVYDWPSHEWRMGGSVELHREAKWLEIKRAREDFILAGVLTPFGRFDADDAAVLKVTGVYAALNDLPAGWTIDWTLFDNTAVRLDKEQFRQVAMAVLTHATTAHGIARDIRDRIEGATDIQQILGQRWPTAA
ncbi:DUF4376 domain-containing protein [Variovorax sp. dw_954]|uniref:DUF4376 domain-containing protein n=1 Tax=Variovorax sp. dw_954 TaxID=2720078 RepID=UPI001BD430C3|nr:DUF4376 domain-containing protein [Variovorax sp. dw_954]